MPKYTAREMLDSIDAFLVSDDVDEAQKSALWNVLTALRGPEAKKGDAQAKAVKEAVTGVIRANAFPRNAFRSIENRPNRSVVTLSRSVDFKGVAKGHFRFHAIQACQALGITTKNV